METPGLKCSICHKNTLFKKRITTLTKKDRRLIVFEDEKSYFSELFSSKANTIKQLWRNLTSVAYLDKSKRINNILEGKRVTDATVSDYLKNIYVVWVKLYSLQLVLMIIIISLTTGS